MKKKSHALLWTAAIAAGAFAAYEYFFASAHVPAGYTAIAVHPGVTSPNIPTPGNGQIAFTLPTGAKGWTLANRGLGASAAPTSIALPSSTSSPLLVTSVTNGTVIAVSWTDANGASQAAFFSFV